MPSNVKVLLVDDNPMVLDMLRQALAQFSTVQIMTDGADAMLKAIDEKPDLIIADHAMPGVDGLQLLQKIKARPNTAGIPVILMARRQILTRSSAPCRTQWKISWRNLSSSRKRQRGSRKWWTRFPWKRWRVKRRATQCCGARWRR